MLMKKRGLGSDRGGFKFKCHSFLEIAPSSPHVVMTVPFDDHHGTSQHLSLLHTHASSEWVLLPCSRVRHTIRRNRRHSNRWNFNCSGRSRKKNARSRHCSRRTWRSFSACNSPRSYRSNHRRRTHRPCQTPPPALNRTTERRMHTVS
jgi:hypothetical protein